MEGPIWKRAQDAAGLILKNKHLEFVVVHHIDADGVSSGAIALEALSRAGIKATPLAVRSMDDVHVAKVKAAEAGAIWFCDLGSTVFDQFGDIPMVICDHHHLKKMDGAEDFVGHVNPLLDGLPGDSVSGSSSAYLVARALSEANEDLIPVALVGASADLQDRNGGFHGMNRVLVRRGQELGTLEAKFDIGFWGPDQRSLSKYLTLCKETPIPGIGNQKDVQACLEKVGIEVDPRNTSWTALSIEQKQMLGNEILARFLNAHGKLPIGVVREVITLQNEPLGSGLRELQEFGTMLNSTARYGEPETGIAVARGDRQEALARIHELAGNHRSNLQSSIVEVQLAGFTQMQALQFVHLGSKVRDTVLGTVIGMAMGAMSIDPNKPCIGFAYNEEDAAKVSSRAPRGIQGKINLAEALTECAQKVGGVGGGHAGAAGATIPRGSEEEFLGLLDSVLMTQEYHGNSL